MADNYIESFLWMCEITVVKIDICILDSLLRKRLIQHFPSISFYEDKKSQGR